MQEKDIVRIFREKFSSSPRVFKAPGRINIIGEHTDYNDGYVLPAAIDKAMNFAVAANGDEQKVRLWAADLGQGYEFSLDSLAPAPGFWATYLMGVCDQLQKKGCKISGFDMVFGGDIPLAAGLSSSAALECGALTALNAIFSLAMEKEDIARTGQMVEHTFAGVNCGIMDQFASVMGRENSVIRLDCRDLSHEYFPFELGDNIVVLCNTRVRCSLASQGLAASASRGLKYVKNFSACPPCGMLLSGSWRRKRINSLRWCTSACIMSQARWSGWNRRVKT